MAGRAHIAGYRTATTLFGPGLPEVRLVAVADAYEPLRRRRPPPATATSAPRRTGEAIADAADIDASASSSPTTCTARSPRRCWPRASTCCARSRWPRRVDGRRGDGGRGREVGPQAARSGSRFRRSPAVNAIREQIDRAARLGAVRCTSTATTGATTAFDRGRPDELALPGRRRAPARSPTSAATSSTSPSSSAARSTAVRGAVLATLIPDRPGPLGDGGRSRRRRSGQRRPRAGRERGPRHLHRHVRAAARSAPSRSPGSPTACPTRSASRCSAERGAATFDLARPAEFAFIDGAARGRDARLPAGARRPGHPYITGGLAMDFPSVGHGQNDLFVFQARAFLDQIAGVGTAAAVPVVRARPAQPPPARRRRRVRPSDGGAEVDRPRSRRDPMALKLGAYTACLHDRSLAEALDVLKANGLTSVEVNTGGFIPAPHCPVDALLASASARADYLAEFSSRGMELTGPQLQRQPAQPAARRRPEARRRPAPHHRARRACSACAAW